MGVNVKASPRAGKILGRIALSLLTLIVVTIGFLIFTIHRSFPQTSGSLHLPGLNAQVVVYRDRFGIPQIYASNTHDLFFAQGYIHAQERFWQMDLWRHTGSGRLSEMLGDRLLDTDRFLRTLGFARLARIEMQQTDHRASGILRDYAAGVNAYLQDHHGSALSLEYALLQLKNNKYSPEPWEPLHSVTWGKMMAWDLGENMGSEISRAILSKSLSHAQIDELYPPYPADHPVILPGYAGKMSPSVSPMLPKESYAPLENAAQNVAQMNDILGPAHEGIGSNNWVISGKRTATGKPILCNDPHLGTQLPSIWYQIGLHCNPVTPDCPLDVVGFSFAGVPGVIIGHNARVAWGFTNVGPDVMDLYIEKINPQNPDQYEVNGQWVDMKIVNETIDVANGTFVPLKVRYTRHGPIISDSYRLLKHFSQKAGLSFPPRYAISLRWTALDPTTLFPAIWKMNIAHNWTEFREAARHFDVPSQNTIYADVDGNIGYQVPGRIPIRKNGDGRYPVPGWTDDYEWTGFIPFENLPFVLNPPSGYVATANNAVTTNAYPYFLTSDWDYGFRAQRIVGMIENAKAPLSRSEIQRIQGDDFDGIADALIPALMSVSFSDSHLVQIRELLRNWDRQEQMDSSAAALFEVFWKHLLADTFHDDLPQDEWPSGSSRSGTVIRNLITQPESPWWDNRLTSKKETRDDIFRLAFSEAVQEVEKRFGNNPQSWKWGDLHTITYKNAVFGNTGISFVDWLFDLGPYPTAGGSAIINATSWDASESYAVTSVPSMRMLIDFSDFNQSLTVNSPGQSGHAFHRHYGDLADLWRNIQYYPMLWSRQQIEANTKEVLYLEP